MKFKILIETSRRPQPEIDGEKHFLIYGGCVIGESLEPYLEAIRANRDSIPLSPDWPIGYFFRFTDKTTISFTPFGWNQCVIQR